MSKLAVLSCITNKGLGAKLQPLSNFSVKRAILRRFCTFLKPFEKPNLLKFGNHLIKRIKLFSLFNLPSFTGQFRNIFRRMFLVLNFISDLARGREGT